MIENNMLQEIIEFSESSPLREVCGFIVYRNNTLFFEKIINDSNQDDYFRINPISFLERSLSNELVAIFHTHVDSEEKPSEYDIQNSKNCLYPFLIYSLETKRFHLFDLPEFKRPENGVNMLKEVIND
mgnify:CR=1 FL=1